MNVQESRNNISFNASFCMKRKVLQSTDFGKKYTPQKVSLLKYKPNDLNALYNTVRNWEDDIFGIDIYYGAKMINRKEVPDDIHNIFILSAQNDNYKELVNTDILGLAETQKLKGKVKINYLQVNPDYIYPNKNPKFKHVGTALLDGIKKKFKQKIILKAAPGTETFYLQNGFRAIPGTDRLYEWKPEKNMLSSFLSSLQKLI